MFPEIKVFPVWWTIYLLFLKYEKITNTVKTNIKIIWPRYMRLWPTLSSYNGCLLLTVRLNKPPRIRWPQRLKLCITVSWVQINGVPSIELKQLESCGGVSKIPTGGVCPHPLSVQLVATIRKEVHHVMSVLGFNGEGKSIEPGHRTNKRPVPRQVRLTVVRHDVLENETFMTAIGP